MPKPCQLPVPVLWNTRYFAAPGTAFQLIWTPPLTDNAGNQGGRKDNCHRDRSCRRTVVAVAVRLHGDDGTSNGQALDQSIGAYGSHIGLIDGKMKCTEPGHIELNRLAHADSDGGRRHD